MRSALSEHLPRLRRYARTLVADPDRADDLVQDCVTRALENSDRWQPGTDLRAWLFTLMHNLHISQVRYQSVRPTAVPLEEAPFLAAAEDNQESHERLRRLQQHLYHLPAAQREVLALVVLEGMSYQQVADILQVPIGTVMSRLSRARDQLRTRMNAPSPRLRRVK